MDVCLDCPFNHLSDLLPLGLINKIADSYLIHEPPLHPKQHIPTAIIQKLDYCCQKLLLDLLKFVDALEGFERNSRAIYIDQTMVFDKERTASQAGMVGQLLLVLDLSEVPCLAVIILLLILDLVLVVEQQLLKLICPYLGLIFVMHGVLDKLDGSSILVVFCWQLPLHSHKAFFIWLVEWFFEGEE